MKSYVLLALCLCASAMGATAANTETPELHLRSLRDQEANAQAQPTTNGPIAAGAEAQRAPGRAVHRVYDAVTGLYCERVGDCHVCPASEKDEVYCRETGHRQELSCFKSDTVDANAPDAAKEQRFQSCEPVERAHPALRVLTFEFFMALILAGAFTLLKRERRKHMSAFDLRKDPRQRSTLLGDKNAD